MNKNLLIAFCVVLAMILALPLLAGLKAAPAADAVAASKPAPANNQPRPAPAAQPVQQAPEPQMAAPQPPSGLNAQTLPGTAWEVATPYGAIQIELLPGGRAVAHHPMVGQIDGNWRCNGNQVTLTASAMGQKQTVQATIQGDFLVSQGQQIRRLR